MIKVNLMYCPFLLFQRVEHVDGAHYKVWADRMAPQHHVPPYEHHKTFSLAHGVEVLEGFTVLQCISSDIRTLNDNSLVLCL